MPNNITNILEVKGPKEDVAAFKKKVCHYIKDEEGKRKLVFDFETTVPIPKELNVEDSSDPKMKPIYEANLKKYGYKDWYWNAYGFGKPTPIQNGYRFRFDTAWSPPSSWLETTARLFPSLEFKDAWIDEGGGAGILTYADDVSDEQSIEDEEWQIKYDPQYTEELSCIEAGDYDDLIKGYIDQGYMTYSSMSLRLLQRIKDKDLPLFVDFEWNNKAKKEFESRLKQM